VRDETQEGVPSDVDVVDEESGGQIEGSEGTQAHHERTQRVHDGPEDPLPAAPEPEPRD